MVQMSQVEVACAGRIGNPKALITFSDLSQTPSKSSFPESPGVAGHRRVSHTTLPSLLQPEAWADGELGRSIRALALSRHVAGWCVNTLGDVP